MTEIRIYEEHNKVVITREKSAPTDRLYELIKDYLEWQDESWEYYRMPLDEFMHSVTYVTTILSATE